MYRALEARLASGVLEGTCASCPELAESGREEIRKV